jgi:threonine aldolase
MAQAEVGDEQRREDPTVNRLLERVAHMLGKDAALFLPSGTMCNMVAIKTHTRPGQIVFAEHMSHVIRAESGGPAFHSNILVEAVPGRNGIFRAKDLEEAYERTMAAAFPHGPEPGLICVEQTHNFGGGTVWKLQELQEIRSVADRIGIPIHMDGARLFNAVVKSGESANRQAQCADTVWIDFTKGLGAPIGAVLAGSKEFIEKARYFKHLFGGAMRQAGIAAAGCIYALDHNIERLARDHENAVLLGEGLARIQGIELITPTPETNMVFFKISDSGMRNVDFLSRLNELRVRMGAVGNGIRAVTHLDISASDVESAIEAVARALA